MFEFGAPKAGLPSLRYPSFDRLFEQRVEEVQNEIRNIERLSHPYTIVRGGLIDACLPNDTTANLYSDLVSITIQALPTDFIADLEAAPGKIGKALLEAGYHGDGQPSTSDGGSDLSCAYVWTCKTKGSKEEFFTVVLRITLPENGIADIKVKRLTRTFQGSSWKIFRKDRPGWIEYEL